jgi:RecA-family ATPase
MASSRRPSAIFMRILTAIHNDEDMGRFIKAADTIQRAFGCVVVIIHHCALAGDRPRGHTSLTGAAEAPSRSVVAKAGQSAWSR